MADQNTPDLASILKTLAGLSQSTQQQSSRSQDYQQAVVTSQQPPAWSHPQNHSHQYSQPVTQYSHQQQSWTNHTPQQWQPPPPVSNHQPAAKPVSVVDPTTITDWSAGLRCVMKTVAAHEQLLAEVRRMIKSQNEHEEQWWKGREELIERQKARVEGQKKLDDLLKGLGSITQQTTKTNSTPEELASELRTFDMKVHRAQLQMVREWSTKLRNLGVPFFGTSSELVIPKGKGEITPGDGGRKLEKGMIHEADLLDLQRKMLGILQDMCKE